MDGPKGIEQLSDVILNAQTPFCNSTLSSKKLRIKAESSFIHQQLAKF